MKIKRSLGEFITIYDEEDNEVVVFQSDEVYELENSIRKLLDYLNIEYDFN